METVEVEKSKLIKTLELNKADHVAEFDEAWEAYSEKLVANLEAMLKAAKSGDVETVELYINLDRPQNHEDDYEQAIAMLEWEVQDTVKLQKHEFANLVQDNWGWATAFAQSYHSNTGQFSKFG